MHLGIFKIIFLGNLSENNLNRQNVLSHFKLQIQTALLSSNVKCQNFLTAMARSKSVHNIPVTVFIFFLKPNILVDMYDGRSYS